MSLLKKLGFKARGDNLDVYGNGHGPTKEAALQSAYEDMDTMYFPGAKDYLISKQTKVTYESVSDGFEASLTGILNDQGSEMYHNRDEVAYQADLDELRPQAQAELDNEDQELLDAFAELEKQYSIDE